MVLPSNPRLMNRVVDAVVHLCEGKGSTARDILDFLRQTSKSPPRNLTMQVHRALKHAVNAGLLRHRSGRYKARYTLNPAPVKQTANEKSDEKSVDAKDRFNTEQSPTRYNSDDRGENRSKRTKQIREKKRKRPADREEKRGRRSGSGSRRDRAGETRRSRYKDHEEREATQRVILNGKLRADIGNASGSSNRGRNRTRSRNRTYYNDLSDSSDYEERKSKIRKRSASRHECEPAAATESDRRSVSRNRSPQRQQSQQLIGTEDNDRDDKTHIDDCRDTEADPDAAKDHASDSSGSGCTL